MDSLDLQVLAQARDILAQSVCALAHQLGNVDPKRIVLHLERLIERKRLVFEVEMQARKCLGVAIEELGRFAANHSVQGSHSLLAIE